MEGYVVHREYALGRVSSEFLTLLFLGLRSLVAAELDSVVLPFTFVSVCCFSVTNMLWLWGRTAS